MDKQRVNIIEIGTSVTLALAGGMNVIGSAEGSGQAVQPEFNSLILFFIGIR